MTTLRRGATVRGVELMHPAADTPNAWVVLCGCGDVCVAPLESVAHAIKSGRKMCCPWCETGEEVVVARYRGKVRFRSTEMQ